jgi:hypothetical protein
MDVPTMVKLVILPPITNNLLDGPSQKKPTQKTFTPKNLYVIFTFLKYKQVIKNPKIN